MELRQASVIVLKQPFAVSENLGRFPSVVSHIAALAHDGINQKVPAGAKYLFWVEQPVAFKGSIGVLRDGLRDPCPEE